MNLSTFYPTVIGFSPNLETEVVDTNPLIEVRFSVDLNVASINSTEKLSQYVTLINETTETAVAVEYVGYSNCVLSFRPSGDLTEGCYYQVTILRGIPSFDGRTLQFNRTFSFFVNANDVPTVTLLEPADKTSFTTNPIFSWNPIIYDTTGVVGYRIQVDQNTAFNSTEALGWETYSVETSGIPSIALVQGTSYFWRVRAEIASGDITVNGDWSDVRTFYLGTSIQPSPSVQQTYAEAAALHIDSQSIENNLSNQASFPVLTFTFSATIDDSTLAAVTMVSESVDGYPDSTQTAVNCTIASDGAVVTITPVDPIVANKRYTISFGTTLADTSGNKLPEVVKISFTSSYSPLYLGAIVLRANFGSFLINYPDDLLNFYIFRASLDLHRYVYSAYLADPTEVEIRTPLATITYAMERWVECKAAERLLNMRYYELLEEADSMKRLGDYTEQRGSQILNALKSTIKKVGEEASEWFAQFAQRRARPRPVVKSGNWVPIGRYCDKSFSHFIRDIK